MDSKPNSVPPEQIRPILHRAGISEGESDRFLDWTRESGLQEDEWKELIREVDGSPYSFSDWMDAGFRIRESVVKENRAVPDIRSVFGYIGCCCSLAAGVSVPPELTGLVQEALDTYGFKGEPE